MIHPALRHLAWRQATGGLRHWARQLRKPRYFVPLILVGGYFGLLFVPSLLDMGNDRPERASIAPMIGPMMALVLSLNLFVTVKRPAPAFTLPEAAQLFTLPFKRRDLVIYTLMRPQVGLLITACFLTLLWTAQARPVNPLLLGVGAYVALNLLQFLHLFSAMLFNRMKRAGAPGWAFYAPATLVLAWVIVPPFALEPPTGGAFMEWVQVVREGPVGMIHAPLHVMAGVFGFEGTGAFFGGLATIIGVCAALFAFAMALMAPFEEAAIANAEAAGNKIDAIRRGGVPAMKLARLKTARSTGLRLAPMGPPWRAALWASVIGEWRAGPWRAMLVGVLLYAVTIAVLMVADIPRLAWVAVALLPASVAAPMMIGITRVMATSLRVEFEKLELLKTLPLDGRRLLRGRVWGAALVALAPIGLLGLAMAVAGMSSMREPPAWMLPVAISALPALAATVALICAIESVLVLLMPAWMTSAKGDMPLDQMGRTMGAFFAQWISLALLLIPPAVVGGMLGAGAAVAGLREWGAIIGLLAGAAALIAECEVVLLFAGRRYDMMDATGEA